MTTNRTMTDRWLELVAASCHGASDADLAAAQAELGVELPDDYRDLMRRADGGEAGFGESWIVLWRVSELVERNRGYEVDGTTFTYFGSNGAGEAYAWDWCPARRQLYVVIPFIAPEPDATVACGGDLETFLRTLHAGIPFGQR